MRRTMRPIETNGKTWGNGTFAVNCGPDDRRLHRRNYAVFMGILAKRKAEADADRWFEKRFGKRSADAKS